MTKSEDSPREEFEKIINHEFHYDNNLILRKLSMIAYDRGHVDGLAEGAELRGRLVDVVEDYMRHGKICSNYHEFDCNCTAKLKALIAEAEGGVMSDKFIEHLNKVTDEVKTWPEWKRNLMGKYGGKNKVMSRIEEIKEEQEEVEDPFVSVCK